MIELRGYIDENGNKRFANWLEGLDASAAAKVTIALTRMEQGNFSNAKGVGAGVYECRIDFGPGYRVYFGKISLSSSSAGARRNGNKRISPRRRNAGRLINEGRNRRRY